MTAAGPLWDAQQSEWLRALGHDVLLLNTGGGEAEGAVAVGEAVGASPAVARQAGQDVMRTSKPIPATANTSDDRLLLALARAAGRTPHDAELLATLPDLGSLRDTAARRALWPRLRALRKRGRG